MIDKYPLPERIQIKCDRDEFTPYCDNVATMYQHAFRGHPWYEDLSVDEVNGRIGSHMAKPGFRAYLDMSGENVVGAMWYDTPSLTELQIERGDELAGLARDYKADNPNGLIVWEREVIVDPNYAGRGIATGLRSNFINDLKCDIPGGALVLTRMRSNNNAIVKIAEKMGFARTGITMPCSLDPQYYHEYWALQIEP